MNVRDAAKRLGVSVSSVYALVGRRAIRHRRVLSRILLDETDVEEYLNSVTVPVAAIVGKGKNGDTWTASG